MANLITGLFDTEEAAENAVSQLKQLGYGQNEISIIMQDRNAANNLATETGTRTWSGVGEGAAIGGIIGGVLGGLLAVGSVTIPGVALIAAGPIAAMFAGAGAGGLAGSLIGWLANIGVPEDVAPYYERGLQAGGIVVAVAAHPGDESRVQQVLQGGAVAYSGYNTPSYVAPSYSSRYADLTPPSKTYDTMTTSNEASRTANSNAAEMRSAERTAAEHAREERRDFERTNPISGTAAAIENEADRIKTGLQNQSDKVSTGVENTTDRVQNP
jgi:uncharacterized membrane protein